MKINMILPQLNEIGVSKDTIEEFTGYDHNLRTITGEWFDMKNMTTDYHPVASPRSQRALQKRIASKILGLAYTDRQLISLQPTNDGAWFYSNGNEVDGRDEKSKLFLTAEGLADRKRSLVRNASYIVTMPDGVVFETANNDNPVKPIKLEKTFLGTEYDTEYNEPQGFEKADDGTVISSGTLRFYTVFKKDGDALGYGTIDHYDPEYRFTSDGVQEYLSDNAMWVDAQVYLLILHDDPNAFDDFSVGDNITFNFSDSVFTYNENIDDEEQKYLLSGLMEWDGEKHDWKVQDRVILEKGVTTKHKKFNIYNHETGQQRAYMIVEGYQCIKTPDYDEGDIYNGLYPYVYFSGKPYDKANQWCNGKTDVTIQRRMPDVSFACESQNRIWCCSKDGHEIYASALGNPYNYYCYSGLSTDSYAVNVGTDGEFTGCCNYLGYPLFFKERALHVIYGSYPAQYSVTTHTEFNGVEKGSERSLAIVNNILYYKSAIGIVAYDGSSTTLVSEALGKTRYKNAVAGAYKNKYYVSMQNCITEQYELFVYDTSKGTWCKEDNLKVNQFITADNELIYATDNEIYSISDEKMCFATDYQKEGIFDWFCETGNYGYSYPNHKYLSRFQIRMQLAEGSRATFYIQYNSDGVWHRKGEMHGKGLRTYLIPLVPMRCDHMKIKIEGRGEAKIYSIAKLLEEGGDQ